MTLEDESNLDDLNLKPLSKNWNIIKNSTFSNSHGTKLKGNSLWNVAQQRKALLEQRF